MLSCYFFRLLAAVFGDQGEQLLVLEVLAEDLVEKLLLVGFKTGPLEDHSFPEGFILLHLLLHRIEGSPGERPRIKLPHSGVPYCEVFDQVHHKLFAFEVLPGKLEEALKGGLVEAGELLILVEGERSQPVENKAVAHVLDRPAGGVVAGYFHLEAVLMVISGKDALGCQFALHFYYSTPLIIL